MEKVKMCSFFGHRDTDSTPDLKKRLKETIVKLIEEQGVQYFLFGSASKFDELCLQTVTELKKEYPNVVRVYIRVKERYLTEERKKTLFEIYDDTIMPPDIENAGRVSYIKRNQAMVDASAYCVFYYNFDAQAKNQKKSGTRIIFEFADQKRKKGKDIQIINLFEGVSI